MTRLGDRVQLSGSAATDVRGAGPRIPGPRARLEDLDMAPAGLRWVDERADDNEDWDTPIARVARRRLWPVALVGALAWIAVLFVYPAPTLTASVGLVALAALSWSAHRAGTPVDWLRIGSLFAAVAAMAMSGYITALVLG